MDYFRIRQDREYNHAPVITNLGDIVRRRLDVSIKNSSRIRDVNVAMARRCDKIDFPDILDEQLFLVSESVKTVFQMYEPGMIFKEVCIMPLFQEILCISDKSIITPDRSQVKRMVIKPPSDMISIFKAEPLITDVVIIRLDVAESLLRRKIRKFTLERIGVDL